MRYPHYDGVPERIKKRLLALHFVKPNGEPDYAKFIKTFHLDPRNFYAWMQGRTPSGEHAERLANCLECSMKWLLLGDDVPVTRAWVVPLVLAIGFSMALGAKADAQTLPVAQTTIKSRVMPLIATRLRYRLQKVAHYALHFREAFDLFAPFPAVA